MNVIELPPQVALVQMMTGYWISQSVYVAAKLGIADLLRDGPRTSEEIAAACQAHPASLYRLLRALASVGVFAEVDSTRFGLTPTADLLRSDNPGSMRALAIMYGEEQYRAWGDALWSIQTGSPAFDRLFGASYFQYLADHPESGATFNTAMTGWSAQVASAVVETYDFSDSGMVVDVGGGHGTLIAAILATHPHMHGILFDLPYVVASATQFLTASGVVDRCQTLSGDFFEVLPSADTYILAQILHDWDDNHSRTILQNCHAAMSSSGRILIIELVIPVGNEPFLGKLLDLHMLMLLTGRERTEAEYRDLLDSAGFRLTRVIPTSSGASLVEAVRR
ncbi:MAG: methyltransferase [Anaerolineae bacterium]|nr:methyltransferase [Anaerolineae bacterium]